MTNYKYLDGTILKDEQAFLAAYKDKIYVAIAEYDFKTFHDTSLPIKQIIASQDVLSKKIILYDEIRIQLSHKLLCDWEQISHYFSDQLQYKIKKRANFTDDPQIKLTYRTDEVSLSFFLARISENILYNLIYNIHTKQIPCRLIADFTEAELSQILYSTTKLIENKFVSKKNDSKDMRDHFIENIKQQREKINIFITNILNKKKLILENLKNTNSQVHYLPNGESFFLIIYEMVLFYHFHKELLEHPTCKALRAFYNLRKTHLTTSKSQFDRTILNMDNLLTANAVNIAEFISIVDLNNIDRFTISHFASMYNLEEVELEALWALIRNKKNGIRQTHLCTLPKPLFSIDKIGNPQIGFYQALKM